FEIAQSRAAEFIVLMRVGRHEHVPEALRARLLLQVFENGNDLPARTFGVLLLVDRHRGADVLGHEGLHPAEPFLLPVRHREIHETLLTCFFENWAALSLRHGRAARALMADGGSRMT